MKDGHLYLNASRYKIVSFSYNIIYDEKKTKLLIKFFVLKDTA